MAELMNEVDERLMQQPKLAALFRACFVNTWQTTLQPLADGTTFVITGDIPAMWLRDSAAQVRPYLRLAARDPLIATVITGVVRRHMLYILHDPYANAFKLSPTNTEPQVWERKYEVDSLCYPLQLAYLLWRATGQTAHFDQTFQAAVERILDVWVCEQDHQRNSSYRFQRSNCPPHDTLSHDGWGAPTAITGMTWSGFRPSDDACTYGYLVPANMFAVVALRYVQEIAIDVLHNKDVARRAQQLADQIIAGIAAHAVVQHPRYGSVYAYETDGLGNYVLMDDANIPSLLSLPYLGFCSADDPVYRNTRKLILSADNPYFYTGSAATGIGSQHTPPRTIWHLALAMQGLTSTDPIEQAQLADLFERTDAGTGLMHESFDADDPACFTRPWFAWANSLFSEFVLAYCGLSNR